MAQGFRRLLRFSLRTLLIAVLLCASIPLLVWNWAPWYEHACIDLWVEDIQGMADPHSPKVCRSVRRNTRTGERKVTISSHPQYALAHGSAVFTRDGNTLITCFDTGPEDQSACLQLQALCVRRMARCWKATIVPVSGTGLDLTPGEKFLRVGCASSREDPAEFCLFNTLTGEQPAWPVELREGYVYRRGDRLLFPGWNVLKAPTFRPTIPPGPFGGMASSGSSILLLAATREGSLRDRRYRRRSSLRDRKSLS